MPSTWLNIGCGPKGSGLQPPGLRGADWTEIRLDADPSVRLDVVAQDRLFDVAYAVIRPYDIIFSHQSLVGQGRAQGHSYMEHKSGYTLSTLSTMVSRAGFPVHAGMRLRSRFELWLLASNRLRAEAEIRALVQQHFLQA